MESWLSKRDDLSELLFERYLVEQDGGILAYEPAWYRLAAGLPDSHGQP